MSERRREARQKVQLPVGLEGPSGVLPCTLSNLSLRGGELEIPIDIALPKQFALRMTNDGKIRRGCNVIWRRGNRVGVSFFRIVETTRAPLGEEPGTVYHIDR
jgi:hypothetical protein